MCEYRRNGVHIRPAGHIDGKAAVLLRDLFGNIEYSAHDWPGKISFGGAANPWDTNFYQNCKISVIVTGSLSGYKPKYSFKLNDDSYQQKRCEIIYLVRCPVQQLEAESFSHCPLSL